jgi:cobalamin transport system substrate-binding protein
VTPGRCLALVCAGAAVGLAAVRAQTPPRRAANLTSGCLDRFDAATDYFPDQAVVEDAAGFGVEYRRSYKVVTIRDTHAGGPAERYVLVVCGAPRPHLDASLHDAQVVTVPIKTLFGLSTTHVSLLADLERTDVLAGVAPVGAAIDVERVVAAKPSLVMAAGASAAALAVIRQAGIPVAANTEWLEATALGRAEWLKFMALFLNEERRAQTVYGAMRARYRALSARATSVPAAERPLVMTGRSTRGLFTIAGGRSYVAALIADAGGRYAWADNPSTGIASVDLEAQLRRAGGADVWINGGGWPSRAAMLTDEPRYAAFKAYQTDEVWVYERRQTVSGDNDYWSRGVTRPDLVLADLVKIFHPHVAEGHAFEWYMRVPAR